MKTKSYEIPKQMVMEALIEFNQIKEYKKSIEKYEVRVKYNLYKQRNRMSSV